MESTLAVEPTCAPDADTLARIEKLYDAGQYLQAYRETEAIGPLQQWDGTLARVFAGRLAANVGGVRLARYLFLTAWRRDPMSPRSCWFHARHLLDTRGVWEAIRFMKSRGDFPDATPLERAHWLALHAHVYGRARDFDSAEQWLAQAEEVLSDDPWILLERAALSSMEDREEDGIRAARRALEIQPWHRPAVQWLAHFLMQKEHDDEAMQLLQDASRRIESYAVTSQLAELQMETGRYQEARDNFEEAVRQAPLLDKLGRQGFAARRCEAAYFCGDYARAIEFAIEAKSRFYESQAERLKDSPGDRKRVCLPVGFVRQHHWTCAPATMAAICRFWSMPGDHLEVAASISYAGTPNHSERQWAIDNGWFTREFTVNWDSARTVIDAGIPFSLTTPEVSSSHLQAIIGYDDIRGTIIIRDPGERHQVEMLAEGLDRYRSSGPRGLAMVPMAEKDRLESLALPDSELYEQIFRMERALEKHDRAGAEATYRKLIATDGEHRMAILAERMLAGYDADSVRLLACYDKLLTLFPDDLRVQLAKVSSLRDLARHTEFVELLGKASDQKISDPAFWEQYADELAEDARTQREAERWAKRTIRVNPVAARAFSTLSRILWSRRRYEEALELSRLAACMEETTEWLARNYFEYANYLGRNEEGLEFLRHRFRRHGKKSALPGQTLAWAYFHVERSSEGYAVLEEAMALRPDDADLMLAVVDQYVQHGKFADARRLAVRARKKSYRNAWLRSVASLESAQGNLVKSRKLWARVIAAQPLAEDAHRAYVLALAETVGQHAAMEHLHAVCERFPHHLRLTQLLLDWKGEEGPQAVEPVVRKLIEMHPGNAWAWRKLALTLAEQNRLDEAFEALAAAEPLEPASIGYHGVHGVLLSQAGRFDEAKQAFREAVRVSADATSAMDELVKVCETHEERIEELAFIEGELLRQVGSGNGLLTYRELAAGTLESEELIRTLRNMLKARPDLWQAWAVVIRQLRFMVELDEALEVAKAAVERFPLLADLWVDLAEVHENRRETDAEIEALIKAYDINPFWATPFGSLVELYRRSEEFDKANALLQAAIARAPLKAVNHAIQARFLWNSGKRHEGFDRMRHTLALDPAFESAWDELCQWATDLDCFSAVVDLAREQTVKRPGEIRSWMRLAQALHTIPNKPLIDDGDLQEECLAALERVLELRPWHVEAHDLKAQVLAEVQRWVEATEACDAPVWAGRPPIILRGRLAWITYQRGDPEAAVEIMAEAVKADREYFWGLRHLAEWCEQLGKYSECLQATERLIALDPYSPVNFVRRAEARRALDDRAGAIADYQRAVELAPEYYYPLFQLFDIHVADGNTDAARKLLDSADPTEARGDFLLRSLKLAMIEKDKETAIAALEDLCVHGDDEQLDGGVGAFIEADLDEDAEDVLYRFLGAGTNVCNQWIQVVTFRTSLDEVRERIENLPPKHLCRLNVTIAYAESLGEAGEGEKLHDWVQANEKLLRSKTMAWGQIGSCYSKVLDDKRCTEWMHDWKERADVQPWMLMNLALAVRGSDRFEEGAEINRHVLENFDSDYTSFYHQTWLMLDEALLDNVLAVESFFELHELSELDANHQWVAALARGVLMCLQTEDKTQVLDEVHESLSEVAAKSDPIDRDWIFELVYRKCIRHIAALCDATGSTWEKLHLVMPNLPNLKATKGAASVHLDALRHALEQEDSEAALHSLKQVCGTGDEDVLKEAVTALEEADLADKTEKVLLRLLVDCQPVCNQWIAVAARRSSLEKVAGRINRIPADHLARTNVLLGYAAALASAGEKEMLCDWIDANEDDLRTATSSWGHIGEALSEVLDYERLVEWMGDWQDREDAEPWMMLYLTLALRSLDRFDEGAEVAKYAVEELEDDACTIYLDAWESFDAALAGDTDLAEEFVENHDVEDLDENHRWVAALTQAMIDCQTADEPAEMLPGIDASLAKTAKELEPIDPDKVFDLAYVHAIRRIAEICEMTGSKWEKGHLKKPVLPKRKAKKD